MNEVVELSKEGLTRREITARTGLPRLTVSDMLLDAYESGVLPTPDHETVRTALDNRKAIRDYIESRGGVFEGEQMARDLFMSDATVRRHVRAMGLLPTRLKKPPVRTYRRSEEEILAAVREAYSLSPKNTLSWAFYRSKRTEKGWPSLSAIHTRFRTWADVCEAAGVPFNGTRADQGWTEEEVNLAIDRYLETTDSPTGEGYTEWLKKQGYPGPSLAYITRTAGGWQQAINRRRTLHAGGLLPR